jgi:hypothetical protein
VDSPEEGGGELNVGIARHPRGPPHKPEQRAPGVVILQVVVDAGEHVVSTWRRAAAENCAHADLIALNTPKYS